MTQIVKIKYDFIKEAQFQKTKIINFTCENHFNLRHLRSMYLVERRLKLVYTVNRGVFHGVFYTRVHVFVSAVTH